MIGIDLVWIPEFRRQMDLGGSRFLRRAFNQSELEDRKVERLAGLWAAKEAVLKAALEAPKCWTEIAITTDATGRPLGSIESQRFELSISHHGEYVVAMAVRVER